MASGTRLAAFLALAFLAMVIVVPTAEAPRDVSPAQVYKPRFFADPIMGIRGDATVLALPVTA
jgi:hypothetical protein